MANDIIVRVTDHDDRPISDAVVELFADAGRPLPEPAAARPSEIVIDQRSVRFDPPVSVVRPGTRVRFRNSDPTIHHVYSFSKLKRFEFLIKPENSSDSITYSEPGTAAIGCNIHDKMAAHIYVARSPHASVTGPDGTVSFGNLAPATYEVRAWHPRVRTKDHMVSQSIALADAQAKVQFSLALRPAPDTQRSSRGRY